MNRKGSETGEMTFFIGKLALAGLIVVLIIVGFYRLWDYSASLESKKAQALIENIEGKINSLEYGENNSFLFQGISGWYFVGWNKSDEGRPNKCFFENCLCVCPNYDDQSCQDDGICRFFDDENFVQSSYTYVKFGAEIYKDASLRCVILPENLFNLQIIKNEGGIILQTSFNYGSEESCGFPFVYSSKETTLIIIIDIGGIAP